MSNVQPVNPNPQSSNNSSANPTSSSKAEDGQKIDTENKGGKIEVKADSTYSEFLDGLFRDHPDWAKGHLVAIQTFVQQFPGRRLPIIIDAEGNPQWLNRQQRRRLGL